MKIVLLIIITVHRPVSNGVDCFVAVDVATAAVGTAYAFRCCSY